MWFKETSSFFLQEEVNISKRELTCLVDSLRNVLNVLITLASVYRFPYRSPKKRLGRQSHKTISLLITKTISLIIQIHKFIYRSDLETTFLAYFPSKSLNYTALNLFLQKLSTLTMAKFTISTRADITLQTSVKLRAITLCSAFTPDCGYDNSTIILIADVCFPKTKCLGKLCLHKNTFQSLGRSDCQCPQCASVCHVRNIPFEDQTNSFFLSFGQGVYIFEESPKSIQDVIGDVYCPSKYCFNRDKCESLGGYVTTPRSIYGCGKWGACLFVHKVVFMLQEHVKITKTDQTRFFFAKKRWTWYPTNNCYLFSHFNQPNMERKKCVWTTKYRRLLEMCIVQHVALKSLFIFQPMKWLVSTTVKNANLAATF